MISGKDVVDIEQKIGKYTRDADDAVLDWIETRDPRKLQIALRKYDFVSHQYYNLKRITGLEQYDELAEQFELRVSALKDGNDFKGAYTGFDLENSYDDNLKSVGLYFKDKATAKGVANFIVLLRMSKNMEEKN